MTASQKPLTNSEPDGFTSRTLQRQVPLVLLAATVFSLGFMKPSFGFAGSGITPTDLLFPILLLSFVVGILTRSVRPVWSPSYLIFGVYAVAMIVSCFFSPEPRRSLAKFLGELYLIGLAVVTVNIVRDKMDLRVVILSWIGGSTVAIIIGLAAIALFYVDRQNSLLNLITYHYGAVPVGNYPRISSTFVSASMFCNYLNVSFFVLILADGKRWIRKWFFVTSIISLLVCAVFTISAGLGAYIVSVAFYLARLVVLKTKIVSRAILVAGVLAAVAFTMLAFVELSPTAASGSTSFANFAPSPRVEIWKQAIDTISTSPFTGKGLGLPVVTVLYENSEGTTSLLTDAHNVFLNVGAQSGLFAAAAIFALCIFVLIPVFGPNGEVHLWLMAAFAASFIIQGLTGSFEDARHLWVLIGLIIAVGHFSREMPANAD